MQTVKFYIKKWKNKTVIITIIAICVIGTAITYLIVCNDDSGMTYSTEHTTIYDESVRNTFITQNRSYTTYGKNIDIEIRSIFDNRGNKIEAYYYVLPEKYLKSKYTYKYDRKNNLIDERMYAVNINNIELKSIDTYKYNSKGMKIEQWNFKMEYYIAIGTGERIGVNFTKLDGDGYVIDQGLEYHLTEEEFKKYMKKKHSVIIQ